MNERTLRSSWMIPFLSAAVAAGVAACDDDHGPRTSTVTGTIAQDGFAYPVNRIIVSADDGHRELVHVAGDGSFSLPLAGQHRYTIELDTDLGIVPLVLDGAHGQYVRELVVRGGGARADIGTVRFYDPSVAPHASSDACVEGFFEASLEPCIVGPAEVTCRSRRGGDASFAEGGPTVPVQGPVAVPERSLPAELGCKQDCGRRGGDDDDEWEDDDGGFDDDDHHREDDDD